MPKKIYEHIIEDIITMINSGEMKEGDRLPPERTLAKTFNVSRNTVREAIKTLSEKKIIESRTGSGTYVSEIGRGILEEAIQNAFEEKKHRLKDIFELRKIIEPQIAYLAAERIKPDQLVLLQNIFEKQKEAYLNSGDTRKWDEMFHHTLAKASDNSVLYQLYDKLQDVFAESREDGLQSTERNRRSVEIHYKILTAVENNDPDNALKHMKRHMHQVEKSMKHVGKLSFNAGSNLIKAKKFK